MTARGRFSCTNFCRPHQSLGKKTTPAMASGLTDHLWTLEEIVGLPDPTSIRLLFESYGLQIQEWDKVKTDWLTIRTLTPKSLAQSAGQLEVSSV